MRRIFGNVGWLLGSKGINAALSLVYLAIATRTLGLAGFGQFTLIVALAQAITAIASFQTWLFVVRWGNRAAEGSVRGRGNINAGEVVGFAMALDVLSVFAGTIMAGAIILTASGVLALPTDLMLSAFLFCVASLLAIRSTPTGILRLHDRYAMASAAEAILPITRAIGAGLAAVFMPTIFGLLLAWAVAELLTAIAYWIAASRVCAPKLAAVSFKTVPRREPGVWTFVWSTNFTATSDIAGKQVLLLIVGIVGGAAMAGVYRVASQLGLAVTKLGQAALQAMFPDLVRAGSQDQALASRLVKVAVLTAAISIVLAVIGGKPLIDAVAGDQFAAAYIPLVILAAASAIELIGASWEGLLMARQRAGLVLALRAIPMLICLAMVPFAIAGAGPAGAAAAAFAASSIAVLGFWHFTRRIAGQV